MTCAFRFEVLAETEPLRIAAKTASILSAESTCVLTLKSSLTWWASLLTDNDVLVYGSIGAVTDPNKATGGGVIVIGHGWTDPDDYPAIVLTDYSSGSGYNTLWLKHSHSVKSSDLSSLDWGNLEIGVLQTHSYVFVGDFFDTTARGPLYADAAGVLGYDGSSMRFKTNVDDLLGCSWLYDLRPVSFDWKDEKRAKAEGRRIGLIAEEVNAVNPKLAWLDKDGNPEGVHYEWLGIPLLVEIKKLRSQLIELQQQVTELKKGVSA